MNKVFMTHEEVTQLLHDGYDMDRGWLLKESWHLKIYYRWKNMWRRCYDPEHWAYHIYKDIIISDEFKLLSNYVEWFKSQPNFELFCSTCNKIKWSVDKDRGGGHYYPHMMVLTTQSENTKQRNLDNGNPNPPKPIIGIKKSDNTILIFKSLTEAEENGFTSQSVRKCCRGKQKSHKGYKWHYFDMNDRREVYDI